MIPHIICIWNKKIHYVDIVLHFVNCCVFFLLPEYLVIIYFLNEWLVKIQLQSLEISEKKSKIIKH